MTSPTSGTYVPPPSRGGCSTGKVGFSTRKQARSARRKVPTGDPLGVYRCPECTRFHLGHRPQQVRNGVVGKDVWLRTKGSV